MSARLRNCCGRSADGVLGMFRSTICRFLSLSLLATAAVALPEQAAADHETTTILFEGGGWGHGVGMSQYGALGRAEAGIPAEEILEYLSLIHI